MRAEAGRQRWSGGHAPNRPPRGLWPHVRFGTIMRGRTRPRSPGVSTVSYTDRQPRCGNPAIPLAQAATHNILYARHSSVLCRWPQHSVVASSAYSMRTYLHGPLRREAMLKFISECGGCIESCRRQAETYILRLADRSRRRLIGTRPALGN